MSTTSMTIFSNPLFATYSVYARNASIIQTDSFQTQSTTIPFASPMYTVI